MMAQISGQTTEVWLKNVYLVKKEPIVKVQSFLTSKFPLN